MVHYLKIWLASVRYSLIRTMMFRFDFFLWSLVELFWMSVNILMISVIYRHTDSVAGWTKYEMLLLIFCGLAIHYSILVITMALSFWITSAQGVEGSYFTLMEFSRLPREAFKGLSSVVFVWILPVVVVSNSPARTLLHGFDPMWTLWLFAVALVWFAAAVVIFNRGLRRYSSASS